MRPFENNFLRTLASCISLPPTAFTPVPERRKVAGMKQTLWILAVAIGQSVLAADVVIDDPIVRDYLVKLFKKPSGKFAPPPKFTKAELASVTSLSLSSTKLTNAGLRDIAKMQNLTRLYLGGTKITDAGLKDIAKLQKLRTLYLKDTKITVENAAELQKALPKCRISHNATK